VAVNQTLRNEDKLRKEDYMNKKTWIIAVVFLTLLTAGLVFAADVCNYYRSGTPQLSARVSITGKTATIDVKSYVGHERIAIYEVKVGSQTYGEWDISGNLILAPLGSTKITVTTNRASFGGNNVTVLAKTCD
jgi:hypothetical protein